MGAAAQAAVEWQAGAVGGGKQLGPRDWGGWRSRQVACFVSAAGPSKCAQPPIQPLLRPLRALGRAVDASKLMQRHDGAEAPAPARTAGGGMRRKANGEDSDPDFNYEVGLV